MNPTFKKIGVIGSGVMGAQIAALAAGVGAEVELLDVTRELSQGAVARLRKMKPPAFYAKNDVEHIRAGELASDIKRLGECELVIEAVVERLDIKKDIYSKLTKVLSDDTILTSNTSGILRETLTGGMLPALARRFFVTHFFNPPRYMKLVEVVGGADTDAGAFSKLENFLQNDLGKGVVVAKDSPLFIANRIGVFYVIDVMHRVEEFGWPIEAVDAVLGRATARPKSGVFRTIDMAGLDTLAFVAAELVKNCPNDESIARCRIPQFLQGMVVKGMTGDKAGRGFYLKDKQKNQILSFDIKSFDHRPKISFITPVLKEVSSIADPAERLKKVVLAQDQAGEIAWPVISTMLVYAANRVPEISDDIVSVDNAMKWGYNWELGPFETWDALDVRYVAGRLEKEGRAVPKLVEELLSSNHTHFYEWRSHRRFFLDVGSKKYNEVAGSGERVTIKRLKELGRTVEKNASASLVDVGDGVFACEFHTKMNAIDGDIVKMLHTSLDRVEKEGQGLLIANDGDAFSVGANLLLVLMAARQQRWGEIETLVREFQSVNQRMRFFAKPVIAAVHGMALGGGCEMCLAVGARVAHIESYMGLVEVGAGVIPAGCGCKNLLLKLEEHLDAAGPQPKVSAAFEKIATAFVTGSAKAAFDAGFLNRDDTIVMDRELLLETAKKQLIMMSKSFVPEVPREDILLPGLGGETALKNAIRGFKAKGIATEYDAFIAEKLAHVLSGGDVPTVHETNEEHILELEREAFLSLVGEERTLARMEHILTTGKPLRN